MNDRALHPVLHSVEPRIDVRGLLYPESIAVVGASDAEEKWGGRTLKYLVNHGYAGRIVPIRPRAGVVQGLAAYASIKDAPDKVDVAVIVVPAEQAVEAVRDCAEAGVGACVVISAQFAEVGGEGVRRQAELVAIARAHGMRLLGPNCLGLVSPHARLALSSSLSLGHMLRLPAGGIGLISQSGALMGSLMARAYEIGAGFSACVSVGNQCDLELCDFFDFLVDDPTTQVICLYVEGFVNPRRFVALAERARSHGKPVLLTKAGRSDAGKRAIQSHTASLAGSHEVFETVCRTYGVTLVDELFDLLMLAESIIRMGQLKGDGVAVFSGSGGGAALIADAVAKAGLRSAKINPATRRRLETVLPESHRELPIDLGVVQHSPHHSSNHSVSQSSTGPTYGDLIGNAISAVMDDPDVGVGLYLMTTQPNLEEAARAVARVQKRNGKPMLFVNVAGGVGNRAKAALAESRLLTFEHPADAIRTLTYWAHRPRSAASMIAVPTVPVDMDDVLHDIPRGLLTEYETKRLLAAAGIPITRERLVRSRTVAAAAAREIGFPVAMKIQVRGLARKSDVGGVRLGLRSIEEVVSAFTDFTKRAGELKHGALEGCLVQEMVNADHELIVGTRWDHEFGPTVLVGVGGTMVEMFRDVAIALAPINAAQAEELLNSLRFARLWKGYRGKPALDLAAVAQVIADVSQLAASIGARLSELDLNPLFASGDRVVVGDARAVILNDWEMPGAAEAD